MGSFSLHQTLHHSLHWSQRLRPATCCCDHFSFCRQPMLQMGVLEYNRHLLVAVGHSQCVSLNQFPNMRGTWCCVGSMFFFKRYSICLGFEDNIFIYFLRIIWSYQNALENHKTLINIEKRYVLCALKLLNMFGKCFLASQSSVRPVCQHLVIAFLYDGAQRQIKCC